jgi:hypothetical protein
MHADTHRVRVGFVENKTAGPMSLRLQLARASSDLYSEWSRRKCEARGCAFVCSIHRQPAGD